MTFKDNAEATDWTVYYAFEAVYHYYKKVLCFNFFFNYDTVTLTWEMALKVTECYKILINCFYDMDIWTGREAKYLDNCELSSKETITIWDVDLTQTPIYQYGNQDSLTKTGQYCYPGSTLLPWGPSPLTILTSAVWDNWLHAMFSIRPNGEDGTEQFDENTEHLQ